MPRSVIIHISYIIMPVMLLLTGCQPTPSTTELQTIADANIAEIYLHIHEPHAATAALERGLTLEPDNPDLQTKLGTLDCQQGDYSSGLRHLNRALNLTSAEDKQRFIQKKQARCQHKFASIKKKQNLQLID